MQTKKIPKKKMDSFYYGGKKVLMSSTTIYLAAAISDKEREVLRILSDFARYVQAAAVPVHGDTSRTTRDREGWWKTSKFNRELECLSSRKSSAFLRLKNCSVLYNNRTKIAAGDRSATNPN